MTLVLTYPFGDKAIFISDFRIRIKTGSGNVCQYDVLIKLLKIGEEIGLFVSGDSQFWEDVLPKLQAVSQEINIENITDNDGTFCSVLKETFINGNYEFSRGLGFIIDLTTKSNCQFYIQCYNTSCDIDKTDDRKATIFGSGDKVPQIEDRVNRVATVLEKQCDNDLYRIASGVRQEVIAALKDAGAASFEKLGISPYMAIGILDNDHFYICGEHTIAHSYSEKGIVEFKHSFGRNQENRIVLRDDKTGEEKEVQSIDKFSIPGERYVFDPQQLSQDSDPSLLYPDDDAVYLFHQWCVSEMELLGLRVVYRSVQKIEFVTKDRLCERTILSQGIKDDIDNAEFDKYIDSRDVYFLVAFGQRVGLETKLSDVTIFDHKFLSKYIKNYHNLIYKN